MAPILPSAGRLATGPGPNKYGLRLINLSACRMKGVGLIIIIVLYIIIIDVVWKIFM